MAAVTQGVLYIDHNRETHDSLVLNINNDGSADIALVSADPKRQKKATSADWGSALDRFTHVKPFAVKVQAALLAENERAQQEGRDADFSEELVKSCIPESFVASRSYVMVADGKVDEVAMFASEQYEMPEPYRIPKPEAELVPAGTQIATGAGPKAVKDVQPGDQIQTDSGVTTVTGVQQAIGNAAE